MAPPKKMFPLCEGVDVPGNAKRLPKPAILKIHQQTKPAFPDFVRSPTHLINH
jgi:hypothetical protein